MADQDFTLTQEYLQSIFTYKDGSFYWKKLNKPNQIKVGDIVGSNHPNGYIYIHLKNKNYAAHRLIFLFHHGYLPDFLDHINRNRSDNRIENLRPATKSENSLNSKLKSTNTSGVRGVCWDKESKKWLVQVTINKKQRKIGRYSDLELAELVAIEAMDKFYGNFFNPINEKNDL